MSDDDRTLTQREREGAAAPWETAEQRNMRMTASGARGWGCGCHGATFCPGLEFVGYEDDVPVFVKK